MRLPFGIAQVTQAACAGVGGQVCIGMVHILSLIVLCSARQSGTGAPSFSALERSGYIICDEGFVSDKQPKDGAGGSDADP